GPCRCDDRELNLVTPDVRAPFRSWSLAFLGRRGAGILSLAPRAPRTSPARPPATCSSGASWRSAAGGWKSPTRHRSVAVPSRNAATLRGTRAVHVDLDNTGAIMVRVSCCAVLAAGVALLTTAGAHLALADDRNERALQNLKHIIVVMQENHS